MDYGVNTDNVLINGTATPDYNRQDRLLESLTYLSLQDVQRHPRGQEHWCGHDEQFEQYQHPSPNPGHSELRPDGVLSSVKTTREGKMS